MGRSASHQWEQEVAAQAYIAPLSFSLRFRGKRVRVSACPCTGNITRGAIPREFGPCTSPPALCRPSLSLSTQRFHESTAMALVVSGSGRGAGYRLPNTTAPVTEDPLEPLKESIQAFESGLTPDQLTKLRDLKSIPDADAVITFTAELDAVGRSKRQRSSAVKLNAFLQSTVDFSKVLDGTNEGVASLVWGSVKFIMLVGPFSHNTTLNR
jgi:hypothetical protein